MNVYNFPGISPLRWDSESGKMTVKTSSRVSLTTKSVLILFHIFFLDFQCIRVWFSNSYHLLEKFYLSLQAGVYTAMIANFVIMVVHPPLLATLINNVLEMQRKYDRKLNTWRTECLILIITLTVVNCLTGKSLKEDKGTGPRVVVIVTLFLCVFAPVTFVLKLAKRPTDAQSVLSLVPEAFAGNILYRAIVVLYQFYAMVFISTSLWFTVSTVTVLLRALISILRTLR